MTIEASELKRIDKSGVQEIGAMPSVRYRAICPGGAYESLEKLKIVMRLVAARNEQNWLTDEQWKACLPGWFISSFDFGESVNRVEAQEEADDLSWDFGSWLEAMRLREWIWWSSEIKNELTWEVILVLSNEPSILGPFEYLAQISGAEEIEFQDWM